MGNYYTKEYLDYDGEWFEDKRSGFGTMYDEQGIVYSELWSNDIPDDTYKRKKIDNETKISQIDQKEEKKLIRVLMYIIFLCQRMYRHLEHNP